MYNAKIPFLYETVTLNKKKRFLKEHLLRTIRPMNPEYLRFTRHTVIKAPFHSDQHRLCPHCVPISIIDQRKADVCYALLNAIKTSSNHWLTRWNKAPLFESP